jgi:peptide/nickel transport system permease protein
MRHFQRFFSHGRNWLAAILVFSFLFVAVAAPLLSPVDPKNPGPYKVVGKSTVTEPQPPSEKAPLGTLPHQLSVYHSLIWGARDAMRFGLLVALSVACIGIIFGAVAGYAGGAVNRTMMRVADVFLTFPVIAAVVLLIQLKVNVINSMGGLDLVSWGNTSGPQTISQSILQILFQRIDPLTISLILFSWMPYARLVNTLVIELKQTEFILAARAIGMRPVRIVFRHILPNAITPAVVLVARDVASFVILQATFTFIGIGGNSIWGVILVVGRDWVIGPGGNVMAYWWVFIPATLTVILFGIAWNLFGDGLGELLDPYTRYH